MLIGVLPIDKMITTQTFTMADVCLYVRMYVCMYEYMYVCMYVCMYACMHACMHACMCVRACVRAMWVRVCVRACVYVCMYVCMCTTTDLQRLGRPVELVVDVEQEGGGGFSAPAWRQNDGEGVDEVVEGHGGQPASHVQGTLSKTTITIYLINPSGKLS